MTDNYNFHNYILHLERYQSKLNEKIYGDDKIILCKIIHDYRKFINGFKVNWIDSYKSLDDYYKLNNYYKDKYDYSSSYYAIYTKNISLINNINNINKKIDKLILLVNNIINIQNSIIYININNNYDNNDTDNNYTDNNYNVLDIINYCFINDNEYEKISLDEYNNNMDTIKEQYLENYKILYKSINHDIYNLEFNIKMLIKNL
jgi:hypothetical protein